MTWGVSVYIANVVPRVARDNLQVFNRNCRLIGAQQGSTVLKQVTVYIFLRPYERHK